MNYSELSLKAHEEKGGKIGIDFKMKLETKDDLSIAYTPGVAEPCKKIYENKENVYKYTFKKNMVAIVTDGTAVLGLGDIGPEAALPVMEGKAMLFKEFGGVDAFPIAIDTKSVDEIVDLIKKISPTFGGINLEDISSPRCVEIERRLKKELDIPVFHDDQHGTAIVVTAALINALKIVNKKPENMKVVINGSGAAGGAIARMIRGMGIENIIICDSKGIVERGNPENNWVKDELAQISNPKNISGTLREAIIGADAFIGVSVANALSKEMVKSMKEDPIIFAMANPVPEIFPDEAKEAGARIVGTGRSDFANQINNVLAFPGLFRGAMNVRAKDINNEMNLAAAYAIADMIDKEELKEDYIIPNPLNREVGIRVARAVEEAARKTGVARI